MRITLNARLDTIAELSYRDILMLLLGREIKIPGEDVFLRQPTAYAAFNIEAKPIRPLGF